MPPRFCASALPPAYPAGCLEVLARCEGPLQEVDKWWREKVAGCRAVGGFPAGVDREYAALIYAWAIRVYEVLRLFIHEPLDCYLPLLFALYPQVFPHTPNSRQYLDDNQTVYRVLHEVGVDDLRNRLRVALNT